MTGACIKASSVYPDCYFPNLLTFPVQPVAICLATYIPPHHSNAALVLLFGGLLTTPPRTASPSKTRGVNAFGFSGQLNLWLPTTSEKHRGDGLTPVQTNATSET